MLGYPQIFIESGAGLEKDPKEELARELRGGDENGWLQSSSPQPDPIHVLDVERKDSGPGKVEHHRDEGGRSEVSGGSSVR